jgi:hypothetical protein
MSVYSDTHLLKDEKFGYVIDLSGFKFCQHIFWHSHSCNKNKGYLTHIRIFFQAFAHFKIIQSRHHDIKHNKKSF